MKYLTTLMLLLTLPACAPINDARLPVESLFRANLNSGSGRFMVQLSPQTGFKIMDSQSGAPRSLKASIQKFRVFLVDGSSGAEPNGVLTAAPHASDVFTISRTGTTTQTVFFDNVPPGFYYACMAAFNHTSNFTPATNISEPTTTSYAEGPCYCSNNGGEADFPGRVEVQADYKVSDPSRLLILPLQLLNEKAATVHADITIQDGDGI